MFAAGRPCAITDATPNPSTTAVAATVFPLIITGSSRKFTSR
jgi:hypothetical protein